MSERIKDLNRYKKKAETLNSKAIEAGYLVPSGLEVSRLDKGCNLGRDLASIERAFYIFLYTANLEKGPISSRDLYQKFYGEDVASQRKISTNVGTLVSRVRKKLGDESIVSLKGGKGYVARRAMIEGVWPSTATSLEKLGYSPVAAQAIYF